MPTWSIFADLVTYYNHVDKLVKCYQWMILIYKFNYLHNFFLKSLSTPTDKASYFLSHVKQIKPGLDIDDTSNFEKLISIMQTCRYNHVQKLADIFKFEIDNSDDINRMLLCIAKYHYI